MSYIPLLDGTFIGEERIRAIYQALDGVYHETHCSIYDLREHLKNPDYKTLPTYTLQKWKVIKKDGSIDADVKKIVLLYTQGRSFQARVVSPIQIHKAKM